MSRKRAALGRGLGALIPSAPRTTTAPGRTATSDPSDAPDQVDQVERAGQRGDGIPRELPIEAVVPNPRQPRKRFDHEALQALANSIRTQGIIQPIVVTPISRSSGGGSACQHEIIAGERRWRAAQIAGLHRVPVFIRETPERQRLELALVENLQRADLDPIEEAQAYAQLLALHDYTQEQLAERVGKDRSTVANALRLLKLPDKIQEFVAERRLSMGHARALLGVEEAADQLRIAHDVIRKGLSVRATEAEVRRAARPEPPPPHEDDETRRQKIIVGDLETRLQRHLGARVHLRTGGAKGKGAGKVEILYADLDDLNRVLHLLMGTSG